MNSLFLDGFVAGPAGEMDWIHVDEEIFDFVGDRTNKADTALYGRVTYEMMEGYWPTAGDSPTASKHDIEHAAWYKKVSKIVLSRSMKAGSDSKVNVVSDDLVKNINAYKNKSGGDIIIFGSPTAAHSLMALDLIDEYWLFINPILVGQGIRLFGGIKSKTPLKLVLNKVFKSGVVCMQYDKLS